MRAMKRARSRRGGALVAALATLLVVMLVAGAVVRSRVIAHRQARQSQQQLQAEWLAESAIERARAQLVHSATFSGETWRPAMQSISGGESPATVEIRIESVEASNETRRIVAVATYPNVDLRRVTVRRELTISLSPTASVPSAREENP